MFLTERLDGIPRVHVCVDAKVLRICGFGQVAHVVGSIEEARAVAVRYRPGVEAG